MGFDLGGIYPINNKGKYFHNSVWLWRPLWSFSCYVCKGIVTPHDFEAGTYNDGHQIDNDKANEMAKKLKYAINHKKEYSRLVKELKARYDNTPKNDAEKVVKKLTNETSFQYPFSWGNVREFAEFVENSGGFYIG